MPDSILHYINLGASFFCLLVSANFVLAWGAYLAASVLLKQYRRNVPTGMVLLSMSLIASTLAYQWFSNAMGW